MRSYSVTHRSISNSSLMPASKRLKRSRRAIELSMTKKEIDPLLREVKSLVNEAERRTKNRLKCSSVGVATTDFASYRYSKYAIKSSYG